MSTAKIDMNALEARLCDAARAIEIAERLAFDEDHDDELITYAILTARKETRVRTQ